MCEINRTFFQVEELINPSTWLDAGAQVFYSFSLAFGGLISFSSYNSVQWVAAQDRQQHNRPPFCTFLLIQSKPLPAATTVSRTLSSSPSSTAAPQCTRRPWSTPSSASGPCRTLTTAWQSEFQTGKGHVRRIQGRHFAHFAVLLFDSNILKMTNFFNYPEGSVTQSNYDSVLHHINVTSPGSLQELDLNDCDMERFLSQVSLERVADSVVWGDARSLQSVLLQGVEGTGLAFIVFTEAIIKMPVSPLWAVLFFVMLFCLGLSTMFGNIEGVVVPLQDLRLLPRSWPKEVFCGNFQKSMRQSGTQKPWSRK